MWKSILFGTALCSLSVSGQAQEFTGKWRLVDYQLLPEYSASADWKSYLEEAISKQATLAFTSFGTVDQEPQDPLDGITSWVFLGDDMVGFLRDETIVADQDIYSYAIEGDKMKLVNNLLGISTRYELVEDYEDNPVYQRNLDDWTVVGAKRHYPHRSGEGLVPNAMDSALYTGTKVEFRADGSLYWDLPAKRVYRLLYGLVDAEEFMAIIRSPNPSFTFRWHFLPLEGKMNIFIIMNGKAVYQYLYAEVDQVDKDLMFFTLTEQLEGEVKSDKVLELQRSSSL